MRYSGWFRNPLFHHCQLLTRPPPPLPCYYPRLPVSVAAHWLAHSKWPIVICHLSPRSYLFLWMIWGRRRLCTHHGPARSTPCGTDRAKLWNMRQQWCISGSDPGFRPAIFLVDLKFKKSKSSVINSSPAVTAPHRTARLASSMDFPVCCLLSPSTWTDGWIGDRDNDWITSWNKPCWWQLTDHYLYGTDLM